MLPYIIIGIVALIVIIILVRCVRIVQQAKAYVIERLGAYKTTWFNYLLPPELKQYFYTKANARRMTKDDIIALSQYALICYEELDTMSPSELNQLKAVVTMQYTNERAAYGHYAEQRISTPSAARATIPSF